MARKQSETSNSGPAAIDVAPIASFESEFERLTSIVDRLEAGNVPLDEMLRLYEQGMTLATGLKDVLAQAELRVEKLAAMHEESFRRSAVSESATSRSGEASVEEDDLLF